jgi:hypothetical protein
MDGKPMFKHETLPLKKRGLDRGVPIAERIVTRHG